MQTHLAVLLGVHTAGTTMEMYCSGMVMLEITQVISVRVTRPAGPLASFFELVDNDLQLMSTLHDAAEHHRNDGHGHRSSSCS